MESVKPSFYNVRGENLPHNYNGTSRLNKNQEENNMDSAKIPKGIKNDDILLMGLILLLSEENREDNYIILIVLAVLLLN